MLKGMLAYVVNLSVPHYNEHRNQLFVDKDMKRVSYNPKAEPIVMTTLTSLVDYIKANIDGYFSLGTGCLAMNEVVTEYNHMILHVVSPTEVLMYSPLDAERKREKLVQVVASVPKFEFNSFVEQEKFIIAIQSKFLKCEREKKVCEDTDLMLKFAGAVEAGTITTYGDDGVSQKATVKMGLASKADALVPNPVTLMPYRTFVEVEQPISDFVFRMKQDKYDGIQCAIFEADGGAWKNKAMQNIKDYLTAQLVDLPMFKIIS